MTRHVCLILASFLLANTAIGQQEDSTVISLMGMSIEELINQKVTIATKSSQRLSETPSVVSVFTAEDIRNMGFNSLLDILRVIPGVEIGRTKYGTISTEIRGLSDIRSGGRILVLLDGTPYNGVMYGSGLFSGYEFNLDAVERVEIIRGPGSALYGKNAFSMVINIISKEASETSAITGYSSVGSFNTFSAGLSYGIKRRNFDTYWNAKYFTTDVTDVTFPDGTGGGSIWNLTHDNYYIQGNTRFKSFQFFGSYVDRTEGTSPGLYFLTNGYSNSKIGSYNIVYDKKISSRLNIKLKIYGRNEHRIQFYEYLSKKTTELIPIAPDVELQGNLIYPEGAIAKPVFDAYTYGGELETRIQLFSRNNNLLLGIQGGLYGVNNATVTSNYNLATNEPRTYQDIEGTDTTIKQYNKDNLPLYEPGWIIDGGHNYQHFGVYLQDIYDPFEALSITLGGRLDYDSEIGFIFNPRLALVWEPILNGYLKVLYGEAFRSPTTNEQYKIVGSDQGNRNLDYEEISTSEFVIGYRFSGIQNQLSLYYNKLDNLILPLLDSESGINSYFNLGENTSYGLDFESRIILSRNLSAFASYSFVESEYTRVEYGNKSNYPHPNISAHKFYLGLNSSLLKYINSNIYLRYVSPISKYLNETEGATTQYVSQDRVGDYFMLNATIRIENLIKGLAISLSGYNLLNQEYYYQDERNAHQPQQPGIHFLGKVIYTVP